MRIVTVKQAIPKAEVDCFWWPVFFVCRNIYPVNKQRRKLQKARDGSEDSESTEQ